MEHDNKRAGSFGQPPENVDATCRQIRPNNTQEQERKWQIEREIADLERQLADVEDDIRYHSANMDKVKAWSRATGVVGGALTGAIVGAATKSGPITAGATASGAAGGAKIGNSVSGAIFSVDEGKLLSLKAQKEKLEKRIAYLQKTR